MYLHIIYNDGSNPFVMLNASAAAIKKELEHQLSPWTNLYKIEFFSINCNVTKLNPIKGEQYNENIC